MRYSPGLPRHLFPRLICALVAVLAPMPRCATAQSAPRVEAAGAAVTRGEHAVAGADSNALVPFVFESYARLPFVRRDPDLDTSGAWIDRATPMVKFFVNHDGIHVITRKLLLAAGIDSTLIRPGSMALYRKGVEVPMYAAGMDDGTFDDGDRFLFIGRRNHDEGDYRAIPSSNDTAYPQYLNKYTDSCAYFLRFTAVNPARIPDADWTGAPPVDSLAWHYDLIHREEENALTFLSQVLDWNLNPEWTSTDTWVMNLLSPGNIMRKTVQLDNMLATRPALITWKLGGVSGRPNTPPNHRVLLRVNAFPAADSVTFNTGAQLLFPASIPVEKLHNGVDTVTIESVNVQEGSTSLFADWFDVEYARTLAARNGRLDFQITRDMPAGPRLIAVRNLPATAGIEAFRAVGGRVTHLRAGAYDAANQCWRVPDTVTAGATYFVSTTDSLYAPAQAAVFTASNIRAAAEQAEYVMIAASEYMAEAREYCAFVEATYGIAARAYPVEPLYDEYAYGNFNPEALKLFLADALRFWTRTPPRYLTLAGDANGDFKAKSGAYRRNYVPTFGFPTSDLWFVCFDSLSYRQSLYVGRLPVHTGAELLDYRDRHRRYVATKPDNWTKTLIFMSGGEYYENDEALRFYQNANNAVIASAVTPPPFGGAAVHFYKTADPPTNFGPFTPSYVQGVLDEGALAISFMGHSASSLWDNSITTPDQLFNRHDRSPVITDFGCASAMFAMPDALSFGERCIVPKSSQAICYIGNTTFGYKSVMSILPTYFYGTMLRDGNTRLGEVHARTRKNVIAQYGPIRVILNTVNMSELLGDPVVTLAIPAKPELAVRGDGIRPDTEIFTDAMDSLRFTVVYANLGRAISDTFTVRIDDNADTSKPFTDLRSVHMPLFGDTMHIAVPARRITGTRRVRITLDAFNHIDETDEGDNVAEYSYEVLSTIVSVVNADPAPLAVGWRDVAVLNPMLSPGAVTGVGFEFDPDPAFPAPVRVDAPYGKTVTRLASAPPVAAGMRYYWRARINAAGQKYVGPYTAWSGAPPAPFAARDSLSFASGAVTNARIDAGGVSLLPAATRINAVSAGAWDGNMGKIEVNGVNVLGSTTFSGYGLAVFDAATMELKEARIFNTYLDVAAADSLAAFLGRAKPSELVVAVAANEPSLHREVFAPAFHLIGATGIDSVAFQSSYACMGRPGAAPGSATEAYRLKNRGRATIDTLLAAVPDTAVVTTAAIGPAGAWRTLRVSHAPTTPPAQRFRVYAVDTAGARTLRAERDAVDSLDLAFIDAAQYPGLVVSALLLPGGSAAPRIASIDVDYLHLPELAMNYQSVTMAKDTLDMAESFPLHVGVLNAGECAAPPFPVSVTLVTSDNVQHPIAAFTAAGLAPNAWFDTTITVAGQLSTGPQRVICRINENGAVREQFTNNDTFVLPYFVRRDTARPALDVLIDNAVPVDGDYVRPTPELRLVLHTKYDAIVNPDRFTLRCDDTLVAPGDPRATFTPSTPTAPAELRFSPELAEGEHRFAVNARDNFNTPSFDADFVFHVRVEKAATMREVMNYPNPFPDATTFTWIATGEAAPDAVTIKVYTVAGRLIRRIDAAPDNLRIGFNTVPWDGRDEDGDRLANGVYFFKLTSRSHDQQSEFIGKISVVR